MADKATKAPRAGRRKGPSAKELETVVATVVVKPFEDVTEATELVRAGEERPPVAVDEPDEDEAVAVAATGPPATFPIEEQGALGIWSPPREP